MSDEPKRWADAASNPIADIAAERDRIWAKHAAETKRPGLSNGGPTLEECVRKFDDFKPLTVRPAFEVEAFTKACAQLRDEEPRPQPLDTATQAVVDRIVEQVMRAVGEPRVLQLGVPGCRCGCSDGKRGGA